MNNFEKKLAIYLLEGCARHLSWEEIQKQAKKVEKKKVTKKPVKRGGKRQLEPGESIIGAPIKPGDRASKKEMYGNEG